MPSALKSMWAAVGQYVVLPLALMVVAVCTVHFVAVFGYEWQWALAKWGYPALCVAALIVLVQLKHWSVKTLARFLVPVMIAVSSVGYGYKAGQDSAGGLWQIRYDDRGTKVDDLNRKVAEQEGQISGLQLELNMAKQQLAAAVPPAPPKLPAAKLYRKPAKPAELWSVPSLPPLPKWVP